MTLVSLVVTLIVIGVLLWLVNTLIPMAPPIKTIVNVVVVIAVCLWILNGFGLLQSGPTIRFRSSLQSPKEARPDLARGHPLSPRSYTARRLPCFVA